MKKTIILLLISLLIALSGCVGESVSKDSPIEKKVSKSSLKDCEEEKSDIFRTSCYTELAKSKGDASICNKLDDYKIGMNNCINEVAQDKKDETVCMMIEGEHPQTICLGRVGKLKNDPSVCDNLKTETWKNQCIALVNK